MFLKTPFLSSMTPIFSNLNSIFFFEKRIFSCNNLALKNKILLYKNTYSIAKFLESNHIVTYCYYYYYIIKLTNVYTALGNDINICSHTKSQFYCNLFFILLLTGEHSLCVMKSVSSILQCYLRMHLELNQLHP